MLETYNHYMRASLSSLRIQKEHKLKKEESKFSATLLLSGLLILLLCGANNVVYAQEEGFILPELQPYYSVDGQTLYDAVPPLVAIVDPNPEMQGIKSPGPTAADALAAPEAAYSNFSITYVAAGDTDIWGRTCLAFPAAAKTAFNAAAAIWAGKIKSPVPIKIRACWANLGYASGILGYSGGEIFYQNFPSAPKTNVWYESSLANSLAGTDLGPSDFDMNITNNDFFTWYFGTDGNPHAGQYDLVTVAVREISHGLTFSGTESFSAGEGSCGMTVYAVASGSAEHSPGPAAPGLLKDLGWRLAADSAVPTPLSPGGNITDTTPTYTWTTVPRATQYRYQLVKDTTTIYTKSVSAWTACGTSTCTNTPSTALGYSAFKWKVQAQVDGVWSAFSAFKTFSVKVPVPTPKSPSGTIFDTTPTYTWTKVPGATQYRFWLLQNTTAVYTKTVSSSDCGTSTCTNTPATVLGYLDYKWKVQAQVNGVWSANSAYKTFSVKVPVPTPQSPTGTISDTTPTYTWTTVPGATQYRYELVKDTTTIYTNIVASSACGASTCTNTPSTALGYLDYKWRVQAQVDGAWSDYSAYKAFSVKVPVPTPQSPTGSITDTTPTYTWTKVTGATQYRFQLIQGTTVIYTNTVASSACGTATCTSTPTTALGFLSYKWNVQAQLDGVWSDYSTYLTFTVADPSAPKAGFWQGFGTEFYVATDQANVVNFTIYVQVTGGTCPGNYKIIYRTVPITNKNFSFSGDFHASGTFDTSTSSHGTVGLTNYPLCAGTILTLAANWSTTWQNASQPTITVEGTAASVIEAPAAKGPKAFTTDSD